MATFILIFIVSLTVLLYASDKFVEAAESIGLSFGIPSYIIGVTIVAFGTSLPELATSIASIYSGSSEVVIGNVLGSNITNIFLIIGLTAIFGRGIKLDYDVMNTDIPMLIGSAALLFFIIHDFHVTLFEALILFLALVIFLASSFMSDEKVEKESKHDFKMKDLILLIVASLFVFLGAKYTIYGLENIAQSLHIPTHIIAITAVALGTSLPELVVSISAARRGQHGMAIGNVLGSNIFNTYAVMSIPRLFGDITIPETTLDFSFPMMIVATVLFTVSVMSNRVSRWEGGIFILFYVFFIYQMIEKGLV